MDFRHLAAVFCAVLLSAAAPVTGAAQVSDTASTQTTEASSEEGEKDAPYVPTARSVVNKMLEVADISSDDVVYDLGSGDGRIPVAAAKNYGARAVGIEIDSALVTRSRANAREAGVADKVTFRQQDFFEADVSDATVVMLYLWPEVNIKLRPKLLRELDPGDRIVSHDFRIGDWEPDRKVEAGRGNTGWETIYIWIIPESVPDHLMDISDEPEINQ
jgi:SAM-dependent methyltransferase